MIVKDKNDKSLVSMLKGLKQFGNQYIEVGHFESQGNHSDSEYSYVDLLTLYAFGEIPDQPRRDVRKQFVLNELSSGRVEQNPTVTKALEAWWENVTLSQSDDNLLISIGKYLRKEYKATFGVVARYMPTDSDGTPLLDSSELREATAYATSKNRKPQEEIGG